MIRFARMPAREYPFRRQQFYDRHDIAAALAPKYQFQAQRGSWGISGIVRFGDGPNYVFFVTFGQKQAEHEFDEAVYANGILRWQSQPHQTLEDPTIQRLIAHNHLENDILLFLRTTTRGPYVFMGFLKYVNHDLERERPVHFHWQILDFDPTIDYERLVGLRLEPVPGDADAPTAQKLPLTDQILIPVPPPVIKDSNGVAVTTSEFRKTVIDYEERDRKNRALGKAGELLVVENEKAQLRKAGRNDLADCVELVCATVGDWTGFDVRTFDACTGEEIHVEVKTTTGPAKTPFFMSAPEVEYAKTCKCPYKIYRVYEYRANAKEVPFFVIDNANDALQLTPTQYRVRMK
jgi:uncharacterized protein DUF3883/uncharacterized protein DUF3427